MKKLIIFCLIVLIVGCGITAGGAAAGGELYSAYYNGALRTARETLHDTGHFIRGSLRRYTWVDDDGTYHSGWFDASPDPDDREHLGDRIGRRVERRVGRIVNGVVDGVFGDEGEAALPSGSAETPEALDGEPVTELDLQLGGGVFTVVEGEEFSISGAVPSVSKIEDGEWKLRAVMQPDSAEAVITVPTENLLYDEISLSVDDGALYLETPVSADEFNLVLNNSTGETDAVSAADIDLNAADSELSVMLAYAADRYHIEVEAADSDITLDGNAVADSGSGRVHTEYGSDQLPCDLDLKAADSTVDLTAS